MSVPSPAVLGHLGRGKAMAAPDAMGERGAASSEGDGRALMRGSEGRRAG
jgi:hypothetical protein